MMFLASSFKILKNKFVILVIAVVLLVGGYYWYQNGNSSNTQVRYITSAVSKGVVTVSVSGTGQVSASNQLDVTPKVSADIIKVNVTNGQNVKQGDILFQLDARDALKTVRDAESNLEAAKLSLDKLKQPADQLSLLQSENSLIQAQENKTQAESDLNKSYDDIFNAVSNTFLNLPNIVTGMNNMLYSYDIGNSEDTVHGQDNSSALINSLSYDDAITLKPFLNNAQQDYQTARAKYDINFDSYKNISRLADRSTIEELLTQTIETTRSVSQAAKSISNLIDKWIDLRSKANLSTFNKISTYQSNLSNYTSQINSSLSSLLSNQTTLQDSKNALVNADRSIAEKKESLAQLQAGTDALDIKSQMLTITQRENSLQDAREKLSYYTIRAPFDSMVTNVDIKVGDTASTGTVLTTLVTKEQLAEISLNEVDVANVKVGQKAILTFDAISDLSLTGQVVDVDAVGTVSQGVVYYNVKINFDTQDDRIKPGMSVSAAIIVNSKVDVLLVPSTAVKSNNQGSYIQILQDNGILQDKAVEVGLVGDDSTEVSGDIKEGDKVVTQTISSTSSSTTTNTKSSGNTIFNLGGGPH